MQENDITETSKFDKFEIIDYHQLTKEINKLNWNKATADSINKTTMKLLLVERMDLIIHIINSIFIEEKFPECLKKSKITPIFKKPYDYTINNIRPIHL